MKKIITFLLFIMFTIGSTTFDYQAHEKESYQLEKQFKTEYVYNIASKEVSEDVARRYSEVIVKECELQGHPFEGLITKQIETESHFRHWRRSKVEGKYYGHGPMQQTYYFIHLLYWYANNRNDSKLLSRLHKIERKTGCNQKSLKRFLFLKHQIQRKKKLTSTEFEEYIKLNNGREQYIDECMKYFMRIGYGVATGVRIMKLLYIKNNNNYKLALLEYWAGRNSWEFRHYRKPENIDKCPYIKKIYNI